MVFPNTVLRSVKDAIKSSGRLPDATTYATFELDTDGGQSNVFPPVVEISTTDTIRSTEMNTDFVGYSEDDNGNHVGRIYRAPFEMPIQVDVWTAEGGEYDAKKLGNEIRTALYRYEDRQEGDGLPNPSSDGVLADITRFQMGSGQPANDLTMTPALRRWRQTVTVWFEEVIDTAEAYGEKEYVDTVRLPEDGNAVGGETIEIVFDATPSEESAADAYI